MAMRLSPRLGLAALIRGCYPLYGRSYPDFSWQANYKKGSDVLT
ncbi:hypothetical protein [Mesorhizobium sp. BR1-1-2]|nr:hypothetical protein [Mesorhizobium sp. BR1-1-2]